MDLNALKQKLDTLQSKPQGGQKTDYSLIFWKPTIGKQQIRIVPSAYDTSNPFTELKFHYGITNKVMISPSNYGEKDPIQLFAGKLRSGEYDKENYQLAKKLDAKNRVFVPVVVRGEESTGTAYNKSSVRVRLKTSPLSENATQVETWTNEQPNPKEGLFKRYSYDEMKIALEKWLSPEDNEEEIAKNPNSFPTTAASSPSPSNFSLDTNQAKQSKVDKFDSLFDSKTDDLPF